MRLLLPVTIHHATATGITWVCTCVAMSARIYVMPRQAGCVCTTPSLSLSLSPNSPLWLNFIPNGKFWIKNYLHFPCGCYPFRNVRRNQMNWLHAHKQQRDTIKNSRFTNVCLSFFAVWVTFSFLSPFARMNYTAFFNSIFVVCDNFSISLINFARLFTHNIDCETRFNSF